MLFGDKELKQRVIEDTKKFAKENNFRLVFGAMVGSISQGLQYSDSDYDTRFLFVRDEFPQKICIPSQMKEEELVFRYYPKDELVYEWIPCWELTSFLQFLVYPSFQNDFSFGLYNIVGWTFQSPYLWDPYGIQNKIMPLINEIFISEYKVAHHVKVIEKYIKELENEKIIVKSYMYMLHSAMTIEWCVKKNTQPPIYIGSLLANCKNGEFYNKGNKIIEEAKQLSKLNYNERGMKELHSSHFQIKTRLDQDITNYILKMYDIGKNKVERIDIDHAKRRKSEIVVNQIYDIIWKSMCESKAGNKSIF